MYIYEVTDHGIDCKTIFLYSTSEASLLAATLKPANPIYITNHETQKAELTVGK